MNIEDIRKELEGYHIEIMLYPSGGMIDATGCEECGTDDSKYETAVWRLKRGQTIKDAVEKLKSKLEIAP